MYKINYFDKKLCHLFRHHLDMVDDNECEIYTIWQFCPRTRWNNFQSFFSNTRLCKAGYFPIIYWLILTISVLSTIHSIREFTGLFLDKQKMISVWRPRQFYVLPCSVLRKCRLVGSLIMLFVWLLLWYAIVKVSPNHMIPWLIINFVVLAVELITWMGELLMGSCKLELRTLFSFVIALTSYWLVLCVQNVFEKAIAMNDIEDLRLWKSI